jgi:hypothetical protein
MMRTPFRTTVLAAVSAAAVFVSCSGDSGVNPTPQVSPTPQPTASPTPTPSPTATPGAATCTLAPGPVERYAIAPRAQQSNDVTTDIRVRARPGFDEVWCVDRTKEHRLDFNSAQKNADGRECCFEGDPQWQIVQDSNNMVTSTGTANGNVFNFRVRINPRGQNGVVLIQATLDGKRSYPWQSNSGYRQEPLAIIAVSPDDLQRECKCIFEGNGIYHGDGCTK